MILIIVLAAICIFPGGSPISDLSNGMVAHVIPYQVSLEEIETGAHKCDGVIIKKNVIITAAHCIDMNPAKFRIRAGTNTREKGGQVINVSSATLHPKFTLETLDYDVAVLELKNSLKLGKRVHPINMVKAGVPVKPETKANISGWGGKHFRSTIRARKLMFAIVPIFDWNICKNDYYKDLTETMICAGDGLGKVDACKMDSGGPMVVDGRLIGIVSGGIGCAQEDNYGIYVNIAYLREWIDKVVKYNTCINNNC